MEGPFRIKRACTILLSAKKIIFFYSLFCRHLQILHPKKIPDFRFKRAGLWQIWRDNFFRLKIVTSRKETVMKNRKQNVDLLARDFAHLARPQVRAEYRRTVVRRASSTGREHSQGAKLPLIMQYKPNLRENPNERN